MTSATRLDASRLDQLALPLLPLVSGESRRYAAAALSRSYPGPQGLVRRLAEEDIAVSAPLLVGSPILSDIDLIGLIGRHGLGHAAAISRRDNLNANIAALIRALGVAEAVSQEPEPAAAEGAAAVETASGPHPAAADAAAQAKPAPETAPAEPVSAAYDAYVSAEPGAAEEAARDRLRAMMLPAGERAPSRAHPAPRPDLPALDWDAARNAADALVSTGLTGQAALFHTALADALELDFPAAASIAEDPRPRRLATALKALGLPRAEAFLVVALAFPPRFVTTAAIRGFFELYASIAQEAARRDVLAWRARAPRGDAGAEPAVEIANGAGRPPAAKEQDRTRLRA